MAGMALDEKSASIEGHEALQDAATLRWGVSDEAEFCVTLERGHWNWQVCTSNQRDQREAVLAMARGYTRAFPKDHVITCENTGC